MRFTGLTLDSRATEASCIEQLIHYELTIHVRIVSTDYGGIFCSFLAVLESSFQRTSLSKKKKKTTEARYHIGVLCIVTNLFSI